MAEKHSSPEQKILHVDLQHHIDTLARNEIYERIVGENGFFDPSDPAQKEKNEIIDSAIKEGFYLDHDGNGCELNWETDQGRLAKERLKRFSNSPRKY